MIDLFFERADAGVLDGQAETCGVVRDGLHIRSLVREPVHAMRERAGGEGLEDEFDDRFRCEVSKVGIW